MYSSHDAFNSVGSSKPSLTSSDGTDDDYFGSSVAVSGDSVVVGATFDNDGGSDSGSAYVFTRSGTSWTQQSKLTANDATEEDRFGCSVAISDDSIVIGAYQDDDNGSNSGSAYVFTRNDSSWSQQAKLTAEDGAEDDYFGSFVAISGESLLVGAPFDDDEGSESGSVHVFERNGTSWAAQDKLTTDNTNRSFVVVPPVAISDDLVVVGVRNDSDGGQFSGSAYVFTRADSTWSQQAKLTADDAVAGDEFGSDVAISGDYVVVGAPEDDDDDREFVQNRLGSAYIFTRVNSSWSQQAKITASDVARSDRFGSYVAISGDSVVVGVPLDDHDAGANSGSAYVFTRSGISWPQEAKLTASDAAPGDEFGASVAISAETIVVGATGDDDDGSGSGSAYIFTRDGLSWSQQAKLTAADAAAGDGFGRSAAISEDTVVVGAPFSDDAGSRSGSAYVFSGNGSTWFQDTKLTASDASEGSFPCREFGSKCRYFR